VSVPRSLTFDAEQRPVDGPHGPEGEEGHGGHESHEIHDTHQDPHPGGIVPADETAPVPVSRRPRRALRPDGD
jgi:hypothetical protein